MVDLAVLGQPLDWMILRVFSNRYGCVILCFCAAECLSASAFVVTYPWLATGYPPSHAITPLFQQGSKRKYDEKLIGRHKDGKIIYLLLSLVKQILLREIK